MLEKDYEDDPRLKAIYLQACTYHDITETMHFSMPGQRDYDKRHRDSLFRGGIYIIPPFGENNNDERRWLLLLLLNRNIGIL